MNNNDNKKSTGLWALRLFNQPTALHPTRQSKTYFAHRYHRGLELNPLSALFSGAGNEQNKRETGAANFHQFFVHESPKSKSYPETVESDPSLSQCQDINGKVPISTQFTVVNSYDETPDTKTFRFGVPNGQAFDYLPGQYITLSTSIQGKEYKRSYSLASSPSRPGTIEITVKRDPNGGLVSNWLNDSLKVGDVLTVKGPFGKFSCINHVSEKMLFIAAGSGIVPVMSMLRWLTDTDALVDVRVLLSFRSPDDIIYRDELKLIAARHKNVEIDITLTTDAIGRYQWCGLTGRIDEKMLDGIVPDLAERTVYLCGPEAFMADCKKNLLKLSLPPENLFCESFTVKSPLTKSVASFVERPPRSKTGNYQISFAKSGLTIPADGLMTLLEVAEKSGIRINQECRSGNCGECMIKCLKGKVDMTDQAEIDDFDRNKGWVYACCSYPASDVEVEV